MNYAIYDLRFIRFMLDTTYHLDGVWFRWFMFKKIYDLDHVRINGNTMSTLQDLHDL